MRGRRLVTVLMLGLAAGQALAAADRAGTMALVRQVAPSLEAAAAAEIGVVLAGRPVVLTYVLGSAKEWRATALLTSADFSQRDDAEVCWSPHPLPTGPTAPTAPAVTLTLVLGSFLVEEICERDPARLAVVIGHELAHLALGHWRPASPPAGDALAVAVTHREREFAADGAGVRYAEQAGYVNALAAATDCWARRAELCGEPSRLEPRTALTEHPTSLERAAELQRDPERREQWWAALAFENGVTYLQLGEWEPARQCFTAVLRRFPSHPATLTNLGYARMMTYYSGLPVVQRRQLGGEISCLAFATTRPVIRGGESADLAPLEEAIALYRRALAQEPDLTAAQSSLGAALLMRPEPRRADLEEAARLLEGAAGAARQGHQPALLCDATANLALVRLRQDGLGLAAPQLGAAYTLLQDSNVVPLALKLNYAAALLSADDRADWMRAVALLEDYLGHTAPESYYYQVALGDWRRGRARLGLPATAPPSPPAPSWLPGTHLTLDNGRELFAQQSWAEARRALEGHQWVLRPSDETAANFTCACEALGLTLRVSRGVVRILVLNSPRAPVVALKSDRTGVGPALGLRVGQAFSDRASLGLMTDPLTIGSGRYTLYRQTGVALQWDGQDRITGIALISG